MNKTIKISTFILALMFLLLPVDMINGFVLKSDINLPLSLAQLYKLVIIFLLFLSFISKPNNILFSLGLIFLLLIPSIFQVLLHLKVGFLFKDIIKITRYLTPVFAFLFFVDYIKKGNNVDLLFKFIKFSFIVFSINILLKYVGLGYPMYSYNSVGSKGFFFAGNETSVVLIILSSILGYKLWIEHKTKQYYLFFIFTLFIGITISSKTGILGVLLSFLLIPLKPLKAKISRKRIKIILYALLTFIVGLFIFFTDKVQSSPIMLRLNYFLEKLDFVTFIFSRRNEFFIYALEVYYNDYNLVEKIIGVGQVKYQYLIGASIVEIDIADIFFAYGIIGLALFVILISYIIYKAKLLKRQKIYPFSGLVYVMIFVLLGISTIAGHVFSSGMAAIFLGLLFSLMYIKEDTIEN
jgi:hypothetical protein